MTSISNTNGPVLLHVIKTRKTEEHTESGMYWKYIGALGVISKRKYDGKNVLT